MTFGAVVAIATMAGPFGTFHDLPVWPRFVYWLLAIAGCGFFMNIGIYFALTHPDVSRISAFLRLTVAILIAAIPSTLVVMIVDFLYRGTTLTPFFAFKVWTFITVIGLAIGHSDSRHFFTESDNEPAPPDPLDATPDRSPEIPMFLRRLKPGMGRNLVSLSMHDHYLEVVTDSGKDMILKRMGDAVTELSDYPGMQIHRSHWVALDAVTDIERDGSKMLAVMRDGRKLPVSRTKVAKLKGLLAGGNGVPAPSTA